jgi:hypothetical protein
MPIDGHQGAPDGAHLLFAARGIAGLAGAALLQAREVVVYRLQRLLDGGARVGAGVGPCQEVFLDRQVAEAVTPFHHLRQAAPYQFVRSQLVHPFAVELHLALGHVAAFAAQQGGDGFQRGRLAGPVRAQQGDDLAFRDLQRHAFQHQDHVIVDDFDVIYGQVRCAGHGITSGTPG